MVEVLIEKLSIDSLANFALVMESEGLHASLEVFAISEKAGTDMMGQLPDAKFQSFDDGGRMIQDTLV